MIMLVSGIVLACAATGLVGYSLSELRRDNRAGYALAIATPLAAIAGTLIGHGIQAVSG